MAEERGEPDNKVIRFECNKMIVIVNKTMTE